MSGPQTIIAVVGAATAVGLAGPIFMLFRNEWVSAQRGRLIDRDVYDYLANYPSYDTMMRRFWVWDVEAFRLDGGK